MGQAHFWLLNYNHRNTNFNRIEIYLLVNDIKANFHLDKMSVNIITPVNFFILWPFHLFPWASYLMTYYPGISNRSNICRSIINYTTINVDIKWKYHKRGALHVFLVYSYFEKGCRKKCTRQSGKVLWVVLSPLFFKEIWQNGTRGHGHMLSLIHIWRCRRIERCRSRWSPYH